MFQTRVLGLPNVVLGRRLEGAVVLYGLMQIYGGFAGVTIVEFSEHLR